MQLVLERRPERSAVIAVASPLIAVALTVVTFAILFAIMGKNPLYALWVYFIEPLTDPFSLQEMAVKATPLVMIAVGLALCYIANVWNIGAEGQFIVGAVCGSWLAVRTNGADVGYWVLPAMLLLGALGGALYALIPAICRVYFGASEILTSLMLVYVANLGMDYLVRGPWRDPQGLNFPTTAAFDPVASVPTLVEGVGRLHAGSIIALVAVMLVAVLLGRTIMGFEIRLVGAAPKAARFSGFSANRLVLFTFAVSGALAGLAGIIEVAGPIGHLRPRRVVGLRLHRHHRRLSRPAQSGRHFDRRAVPGADLHRRRGRANFHEGPARPHQGVPGHLAVLRARLRLADRLPHPSRTRRSKARACCCLKPSSCR